MKNGTKSNLTVSASQEMVVGVDVGGGSKGFHAVALKDGFYHGRFKSCDAAELAQWCAKTLRASMIAVDAPCRWSITGKSRPAERELQGRGIHCFFTPTREVAEAHPGSYFAWMFNGEALFKALEKDYSLCRALPKPGERCCFETFPHAITWHLRGGNADAKRKRSERLQLLEKYRIATEQLTNIDWMDAAICALAANIAASGKALEAFGEDRTGFIITPGMA